MYAYPQKNNEKLITRATLHIITTSWDKTHLHIAFSIKIIIAATTLAAVISKKKFYLVHIINSASE